MIIKKIKLKLTNFKGDFVKIQSKVWDLRDNTESLKN